MTYASFQDVIDAWPSRAEFAADIGAKLSTVHKMHEVNSIRGVYFHAIVAASKRRNDVSMVCADDLCRLAARLRDGIEDVA
ncbi:hypothetical protein O4H61_03420 [Roseovarius aestuarii]|nr:hypothetical protein [Roseovarius aestuarii]